MLIGRDMRMVMLTTRLLLLNFIGFTLLSAPAFAGENNQQTTKSPLSPLYTCSEMDDSMQRLACFDASVAKLRAAEQNKEVVAIDAKVAQKIKREAFGFNLPSLSKIGLPKVALPSLSGKKKADALVADVKSIRKSGRGLVITLKNGQVWKETGGRLNYIPKGDLTATIKAKSVGSFLLSLNNGKTTVRGLRVRRVE